MFVIFPFVFPFLVPFMPFVLYLSNPCLLQAHEDSLLFSCKRKALTFHI